MVSAQRRRRQQQRSNALGDLLLLTSNHHNDNTVNLFVGRVGRDVAEAHAGERGEREIE